MTNISTDPQMKFLFNFSVSYTGGGKKRLLAYSHWFNEIGGATFVVHPKTQDDVKKFDNNTYYFVKQSKFSRLFNDTAYLDKIIRKQQIDCYFSYGIPIYKKIAALNWFHLSNLLPLKVNEVSVRPVKKLEMNILRMKIAKNLIHCDAVSAESQYALDECLALNHKYRPRIATVLENGIDLALLENLQLQSSKNLFAVSIGTYSYKRLDLLLEAFLKIKERENLKKLILMGEIGEIPKNILTHPLVECVGTVPIEEVYSILRTSKVFLSTSQVENSSNASLEGLLLCEKAYLSDIPPHHELLTNYSCTTFKKVNLTKKLTLLEIKPTDIKVNSDRMTWDHQIAQFLLQIKQNF